MGQAHGETLNMSDERDFRKVIPLLQPEREASVKQLLSEIYNAVYLLNLATDLEGIRIEDPEIGDTKDGLQQDLISVMRQIHGYAERASRAFLELVKKHRLDYLVSNK